MATHVESDSTSGGKFVGNVKMEEAIIHDAVDRCQYSKKLSYQWMLWAHASDLYLAEAVAYLNEADLTDAFYFGSLTKDHFSLGGSKSATFNLSETVAEYRKVAYDSMSIGMMKTCYSDNNYRNSHSGRSEADAKALVDQTKTLVTWYFYTILRFVQYNALAVWKDVVGENIDFQIAVPNWKDLTEADQKKLKDMEATILDNIGPSFKIIEAEIRMPHVKKRFVKYLRSIMDTYVYLNYVMSVGLPALETLNKVGLNIIHLKADGHLLMDLLLDQKFYSGEDAKNLLVVKSLISEIGNTLESAFVFNNLFKRAHDDSFLYKKVVDDYSFCSLINYRNKYSKYILHIQKVYAEIYVADKDTAKSYDLEFVKKIGNVYPSFVLDALMKAPTDEDADLEAKHGLAKSLQASNFWGLALNGRFTNLFVTHAYNKSDSVKEFTAVYNRYKVLFTWKMTHEGKLLKNTLYACRGCGGMWAIADLATEALFYNTVPFTATDKTHFQVNHRLVGTSTLKAVYSRMYTYTFEEESTLAEQVVQIDAPSKSNPTLYSKLVTFYLTASTELKLYNLERSMFIKKSAKAAWDTSVFAAASSMVAGVKVAVVKEEGKDDLCRSAIAADSTLTLADTHDYTYLLIGPTSANTAGLKGCAEIPLVKVADLGDNHMHVPVFVNRLQEWKKFDIIWSYKAKLVSEGLEDLGNYIGVSYLTFLDNKLVSAAAFDAAKLNDYLSKALSKRDLTPYALAVNNEACVYKNNKVHTMDGYLQNKMRLSGPNLEAPEFNFKGEEGGVPCAQLDKLLNFDNLNDFNNTISDTTRDASALGEYANCGSFRKTVKITSKYANLFLVFKGKVKEQQFDLKSFKVGGTYYLHARIAPSFKFSDYLKFRMMPAHWLKIKPIKLGDKNSFLFLTVMTNIGDDANFLGVVGNKEQVIGAKSNYKLPGFDKSKDFINANLTSQLYSKGVSLSSFNSKVDAFITQKASSLIAHREFVKVQYDHSVKNGCDKGFKGISILINKDYKIEETCGTSPLVMDSIYYIEVLYVSAKEATRLKNNKFAEPSADELAAAGHNGFVLYDAGKKYDVLDVKIGEVKYRIWAKPEMTMPYELESKKK